MSLCLRLKELVITSSLLMPTSGNTTEHTYHSKQKQEVPVPRLRKMTDCILAADEYSGSEALSGEQNYPARHTGVVGLQGCNAVLRQVNRGMRFNTSRSRLPSDPILEMLASRNTLVAFWTFIGTSDHLFLTYHRNTNAITSCRCRTPRFEALQHLTAQQTRTC